MASVFALGPSLDSVTEPEPQAAAVPGRRQIMFHDPATEVGGKVHLKLVPPAHPDDVPPVNVYAFFVSPPSSVPPAAQRTPEWFFGSGHPNASSHVGTADANGVFTVSVPGVKPGVHFVQTVLEFNS